LELRQTSSAGLGISEYRTILDQRWKDERVRIEVIEPLASLTEAERELLDEMLEDHPDLDRAALVVYRTSGSGRPLVAPANVALRAGITVVCDGWTETAQSVSSDNPERVVEVGLAAALSADDLDL
jgi:hypothetical protein